MTINWENIKEYKVLDGANAKFLHTDTMTFVLWRFDKGADLPLHHHIHEQVTIIEKGKFELHVDGKAYLLGSGDVFPIKSNLEHGGKAIEETLTLDIFNPVREDFKEKFS